jgi:excisionase family DNA binding protein
MPEFKSEPVSISIAECCHRLGVGEGTLRALLDSGQLPYSRIPGPYGRRGRVVVRVSDLDALLDDFRAKPKPKRTTKRRKAVRS